MPSKRNFLSVGVSALLLVLIFAAASQAQIVNYVSTWSSTVSYLQYQVVLYSGSQYYSLTTGNVGNTPSSSSTYWRQLLTSSTPTGGAGAIVAPSVQGVFNASVIPSAASATDLGQNITTYLSSCSYVCTVYIPSGHYSYSHPISLTTSAGGTYKLIGEKGTVLTYTGTGDAILVTPNTGGGSNLSISGFQLTSAGSATNGIRVQPQNDVTIDGMYISGFTAGINMEGADASTIQNSTLENNTYGIEAETSFCTAGGSCSPTGSGTLEFDPNALHIHDNHIHNNADWGFFLYAPAAHGIARGNVISSNTFEENGSSSSYGDIFFERGLGTLIEGNYFEPPANASRHIVLGSLGGGSGNKSTGDHITGNYFNDATTTPYNIELENTQSEIIDGNSDLYTTSPICEIQTPASGDEAGTQVGLNGFSLLSGTTTLNYLTCVGSGTSPAYLPGVLSATQPITESAVVSGCTIAAGSVGTICTASGSWSPAFLVTPTLVSCTLAVAGSGANGVGAITGLSATGIDVQEISLSSSATGGGAIVCTAQYLPD